MLFCSGLLRKSNSFKRLFQNVKWGVEHKLGAREGAVWQPQRAALTRMLLKSAGEDSLCDLLMVQKHMCRTEAVGKGVGYSFSVCYWQLNERLLFSSPSRSNPPAHKRITGLQAENLGLIRKRVSSQQNPDLQREKVLQNFSKVRHLETTNTKNL